MICKPCALAADLLTHFHESPILQVEDTKLYAEKLHKDCKGCGCQHRMEVGLYEQKRTEEV